MSKVMVSFLPPHKIIHPIHRFPLHTGQDVAIDIQGGADAFVAQDFLHLFGVYAGGHEQGGAGVTQIVEADVRAAKGIHDAPESSGHIGGVMGSAVIQTEDQIHILVFLSQQKFMLGLLTLMLL